FDKLDTLWLSAIFPRLDEKEPYQLAEDLADLGRCDEIAAFFTRRTERQTLCVITVFGIVQSRLHVFGDAHRPRGANKTEKLLLKGGHVGGAGGRKAYQKRKAARAHMGSDKAMPMLNQPKSLDSESRKNSATKRNVP